MSAVVGTGWMSTRVVPCPRTSVRDLEGFLRLKNFRRSTRRAARRLSLFASLTTSGLPRPRVARSARRHPVQIGHRDQTFECFYTAALRSPTRAALQPGRNDRSGKDNGRVKLFSIRRFGPRNDFRASRLPQDLGEDRKPKQLRPSCAGAPAGVWQHEVGAPTAAAAPHRPCWLSLTDAAARIVST
jgi:hypothetical protein